MAAYADRSERFVEIPGIVEIRWNSDDPDFYVEPEDLFDKQGEGLPDWYGVKNKGTTEQAFFNCNICECELKSVVTLRAHCKGTQHVRKALQKKKEYRDAQKKKKGQESRSSETMGNSLDTSKFTTLFQWLDSATSEAVVGLEQVTEYKSGEGGQKPYYHCKLEGCNDEQGNAEQMKTHLFTLRHKQAWLMQQTGEFIEHQSFISQKIAEFTKDFRRDYTVMDEVVDRELWERCRKGRMTSRRVEPAPMKREVKEEGGGYQEWKRRRREGERDSRNNSGRRERDAREDEGRRERNGRSWRNEEYSWREERPGGDRRREGNLRSTPPTEFKRETDRGGYRERKEVEERQGRSRLVEEDRWGSSMQDTSHYSNDSGRGSVDGYGGGGPAYHDDGLEELGRSGDFTNWKTTVVKRDVESRRDEEPSTSVFLPPAVERGEEEDIDRLHRKVRDAVRSVLNCYWPDAEEYMGEHKIGSREEYSSMAQEFCHRLRSQIKESYLTFHGTLKGIVLTSDHKMTIKMEIEMAMEKRPLLNRRRS